MAHLIVTDISTAPVPTAAHVLQSQSQQQPEMQTQEQNQTQNQAQNQSQQHKRAGVQFQDQAWRTELLVEYYGLGDVVRYEHLEDTANNTFR